MPRYRRQMSATRLTTSTHQLRASMSGRSSRTEPKPPRYERTLRHTRTSWILGMLAASGAPSSPSAAPPTLDCRWSSSAGKPTFVKVASAVSILLRSRGRHPCRRRRRTPSSGSRAASASWTSRRSCPPPGLGLTYAPLVCDTIREDSPRTRSDAWRRFTTPSPTSQRRQNELRHTSAAAPSRQHVRVWSRSPSGAHTQQPLGQPSPSRSRPSVARSAGLRPIASPLD